MVLKLPPLGCSGLQEWVKQEENRPITQYADDTELMLEGDRTSSQEAIKLQLSALEKSLDCI